MDELLTAAETKRILKCSLALVYRMAERGQIPCVRWECPTENGERLKTMVRFKKTDVLKFIERHYQN